VGKLEEDTVFSWPNLLIAEMVVLLVTVIGLMLASIFFNAPLEHPVNIMHPPNPAKAPWYFLGLQEQVSYSALWGGLGVPAIELLLLILVPYIDRGKAGVGRWFARERVWANTLFLTFVFINVVLIVIGTFFRGANWSFVSPFWGA
jgi:quinol-cytochrome oxidoreductase complex cytochrome b subunit